jgi:hypothetical protein
MLSLFRVFVGLSLCFLFLRDMFRWMPWATPYESLRAQAASSHDGGGGRQAGNDALWALDNLSWPPPLVTMHTYAYISIGLFAVVCAPASFSLCIDLISRMSALL